MSLNRIDGKLHSKVPKYIRGHQTVIFTSNIYIYMYKQAIIHNLVDSEHHEHREALIGMRSALDTWIVETNDQGEFPEDEAIVKPFEKEMHDWFGTPPWHPYKPEENP